MKLQNLRKSWEEGLRVFLEIPLDEFAFIVILVNDHEDISPKKDYHMHRYFKIGDKWEISADCQSTSLADIVTVMAVKCQRNWIVPKE